MIYVLMAMLGVGGGFYGLYHGYYTIGRFHDLIDSTDRVLQRMNEMTERRLIRRTPADIEFDERLRTLTHEYLMRSMDALGGIDKVAEDYRLAVESIDRTMRSFKYLNIRVHLRDNWYPFR